MKPTLEQLEGQFRALANEAQPLQVRVTELTFEQVKLAQQINLEILKAAYPKAKVIKIKPLGAVKPTQARQNCEEVISGLAAVGREPSKLVVDEVRMIITLVE